MKLMMEFCVHLAMKMPIFGSYAMRSMREKPRQSFERLLGAALSNIQGMGLAALVKARAMLLARVSAGKAADS